MPTQGNVALISRSRRPLSASDMALLVAHPKEVKVIAKEIGERLEECLAAEKKAREENAELTTVLAKREATFQEGLVAWESVRAEKDRTDEERANHLDNREKLLNVRDTKIRALEGEHEELLGEVRQASERYYATVRHQTAALDARKAVLDAQDTHFDECKTRLDDRLAKVMEDEALIEAVSRALAPFANKGA